MNNHIQKILVLLKAIFIQLKEWFLDLNLYQKVGVVVGVLVVFFGANYFLSSKDASLGEDKTIRSVVVANVGDLSSRTTPLPLVGQVTSVSEATVRAESSGRLTRVYKKLGDRVVAGQVIAEFENSGERASVLQAEGAYESAKAARDIAIINSSNTNVSLGDTKTNTINAINATYATLDDIIRVKTDSAFSDPRSDNSRLRLTTTDSILAGNVEQQRKQIEKILVERFAKNLTLTQESDLLKEIQIVQSETQIIKNYLDDLGSLYVKSLPDSSLSQTALDGGKTTVGVARSTIASTLTSLSASKVALQNAIASQEVAGRTTGASAGTATASADAQVKTAQGGYLASLSRLEKTIIRSPITGTLNSFSIETGDFVSQTTQVAVVSNNGALEIVTYITPDDLKRVAAGANVKINGTMKGIVTRIASAVDPVTKKIEVRIGILDDKSGLVNGQSARIEIGSIPTQATTGKFEIIKIPLSAVKITPRETYVFTLSASSTLERVAVELGTLLGEEVEIKSGLTSDMNIVKDARGLKEGQVVKIKE